MKRQLTAEARKAGRTLRRWKASWVLRQFEFSICIPQHDLDDKDFSRWTVGAGVGYFCSMSHCYCTAVLGEVMIAYDRRMSAGVRKHL